MVPSSSPAHVCSIRRLVRSGVVAFADLLCPERCAACPRVVHATTLFCSDCRCEINVLAPSDDPAPDATFRSIRAWAAYRGSTASSPVARALAAFKYGHAQRLGARMATVMTARAPRAIDVIVPIPLHSTRLRARGFNQSAVLARSLASALDTRAALRTLRRARDTPSQTALSVVERAANVAGAFVVTGREAIADRDVLLVDDVWTSGATARAAAAALREAGAAAVDVLTFARVL